MPPAGSKAGASYQRPLSTEKPVWFAVPTDPCLDVISKHPGAVGWCKTSADNELSPVIQLLGGPPSKAGQRSTCNIGCNAFSDDDDDDEDACIMKASSSDGSSRSYVAAPTVGCYPCKVQAYPCSRTTSSPAAQKEERQCPGAPVSPAASAVSSTVSGTSLKLTPSTVKVAVVVRPLLEFEQQKGATSAVCLQSPDKVSLTARPGFGGSVNDGAYDFRFDRVYNGGSPAAFQAMYVEMVQQVLGCYCQGFNGTILAYGQTGAGKTHQMGTAAGLKDISANARAIIPRACSQILEYMAAAVRQYDISLKIGKGEIVLDGVTEMSISSRQDIARLLEKGNAVRATAAHKLNQNSSRSHAILTLTMEQRVKPAAAASLPSELRYLRSKLHLVDLAGSERAKETGTTGQRFTEGVAINKGLLELGNVINALTEGTTRKHIPYRNSKLTRLLQDSLGGNSETLFIACISPADSNRDHTISTLRYASRAMKIKNSLKLNNQLSTEEEMACLRQLVTELTEENGRLKAALAASPGH
eukprot:gene3304-3582_t